MKAVQLLVNSKLPVELRNYDQTFDGKSINKILVTVKRRYPDKFAEIAQVFSDIGRNASYAQGDTISLKDVKSPIDRSKYYAAMDAELAEAKKRDPQHYKENKEIIWQKWLDKLGDDSLSEGLKQGNMISLAVASGARGKKDQHRAMTVTPGTYTDSRGRVIDIFSRESFAEGVRPATLMASMFGTRAAISTIKTMTAKGGDWGKIMGQAAASQVIRKNDCLSSLGIPISTEDKSLHGRFLSSPVGDFPAGTLINKNVQAALRKSGVKNVIARSPITCDVPNGLCAKCVGAYYKGGQLPKIGDAIGLMASTTVAEPIVQSSLGSKHSAGMSTGKREYSGFEAISSFTQSPENFKDKAVVADQDGRVEKIETAAQGGHYVTINGKKQYTPAGYALTVQEGDTLEAGDQLSDGILDPEDIVKHKGIGEGRVAYVKELGKILNSTGVGTDPRNLEVLSRAAINHVRIDAPEGLANYLPDDVVSYDTIKLQYTPNISSSLKTPKEAINKYLQAPTLYYSVGTRITPSVAKKLSENNINTVQVDDVAPEFTPEMIRLRTASHMNPDWIASMSTSYIKQQVADAAVRGDDSNYLQNDHYAPRLAYGADFAKNIGETGQF